MPTLFGMAVRKLLFPGLAVVLLLPIAPEMGTPGEFHDRMRWVKQFYKNEEKFWILKHLEAIKADCDALTMDVKKSLKLKDVDDDNDEIF